MAGMDYYGLMRSKKSFLVVFSLWASSFAWQAALAAQPAANPESPSSGAPDVEAPPVNSALSSELFYQLITGELRAQGGDPAGAYPFLLDAARRTGDGEIYRRAVEVALQARSGDTALQAARAWRQALPSSREANRYVLQILIGLNRLGEVVDPLKRDFGLVSAAERPEAITVLPRFFNRASNKKAAANAVELALVDQLLHPDNGPAAWTTIGRMRLEAGDVSGALTAAERGQAINVEAEGPAMLALTLIDLTPDLAEAIVRKQLASPAASASVRLAYARALINAQRYEEARRQVRILTLTQPDLAQAWLILGTLSLQSKQWAQADVQLRRYVELARIGDSKADQEPGLVQAYLSLATIAEQQGDLPLAQSWLERIDNGDELMGAQSRRASLLARQGKIEEARLLLRSLPEKNEADARLKMLAEVQLLRDNKRYEPAYALLKAASEAAPQDTDLLYDLATLAEKMGDLPGMEALLRRVMAAKPQSPHAYNALGYSFAERGIRLDEARGLILQALEYAPKDPFITDSLGWLEFRAGNLAQAQRILREAYQTKPDTEIGAHLGEVLWVQGERTEAMKIWREAQQSGPGNDTLIQTLQRLGVNL